MDSYVERYLNTTYLCLSSLSLLFLLLCYSIKYYLSHRIVLLFYQVMAYCTITEIASIFNL